MMQLSWPQRWTQPGNRPTATAQVSTRRPRRCGRHSAGGTAARRAEQKEAAISRNALISAEELGKSARN